MTSCNNAVDLNPELADAYDERANAYTWLRDYERAIADYGTVLKLRPSYFYAYNNRGNAYAALGEFDHAIADYGVALRVRPDYAEAYGNRGSAFAAISSISPSASPELKPGAGWPMIVAEGYKLYNCTSAGPVVEVIDTTVPSGTMVPSPARTGRASIAAGVASPSGSASTYTWNVNPNLLI